MHSGSFLDEVLKLLGSRGSPRYNYKSIEKRIEKILSGSARVFAGRSELGSRRGIKGVGGSELEKNKKGKQIYMLDRKGRQIRSVNGTERLPYETWLAVQNEM